METVNRERKINQTAKSRTYCSGAAQGIRARQYFDFMYCVFDSYICMHNYNIAM